MNQIHGHEVMKMMIQSGKSYTGETLRNEIIQQFGEDARFYTCSAENMTADEIIRFLGFKEKFIDTDEGFITDPSKICDH